MRTSLAVLLAVLYLFPAGGALGARPVPAYPEAALLPPSVPWRYVETLATECAETGVPYWIAARLFAWESGWRAAARNVNPNGTEDLGIAQLNSAYLSYFARFSDGPLDPLDGHTSIRVGVRYLAELYRATGSWRGAVAAYNCGPGRYRRGNLPAGTVRHVRAVLGAP